MALKQNLSLIFFLVLTNMAISQKTGINGWVFDSKDDKSLPSATVVIKTMRDSIITGAITDEKGYFEINQAFKGNYKVVVDYIGYSPFQKIITISSPGMANIGKLSLTENPYALKEVNIVENAIAVKIKGDTTEFNAASYKVEANAMTEDLVKKMPGMEIQDGKVTAQGQEVKRVVVDGKQFFGDDPMLSLKNLPAEVVDKVQLIDQLSEQSQFTGFDDGQRVKTLNIVTKKDRKKGYFGRVSAATNGNDHYNGNGTISYFNGNRRISLIGGTNNTNEMAFSMQDILGVMGSGSGGGNRGGQGGSGMGGMRGGGAGNFSFGQGNGINTITTFGLNYNDEWSPKFDVQANYFYNYNNNINTQLVYQEYFLQNNTSQFINKNNYGESLNKNHRMNMRLEYQIDSLNSLMFRPQISLQNNNRNTNAISYTLDQLYAPMNNSVNGFNSNTLGYNFNGELLFRHKFSKKGRTFSIGFNSASSNNDGNNKNLSSIYYHTINDTSIQNTEATSNTSGYSFSPNISYTEPMTKNSILQLNYNLRYNSNNSDKFTYDYDELTDLYEYINAKLSNQFDNSNLSHRAGISYMFLVKKVQFTFGTNYQRSELNNNQVYPRTVSLSKSFDNFLPSVRVQYRLDRRNSLELNYFTSMRAPGISQLQNVPNLDNPLLVTSGNPGLKQEYTQTLTTRFSKVNSENNRTIMFVLGGSFLNNKIATSTLIITKNDTIDNIPLSSGAQYSKPINITTPYYNINSFFTYGIPIFKQKINLNFNTGVTFTYDPGLVNGQENIASSYKITQGLVIGSNISKNLDFTLSGNLNYNIVKYSFNSNQNRNYTTNRLNLRFNYIFWKGFLANTSVSYLTNRGLNQGYNSDYTLWNAAIGKQLLKNNAEIRLTVYDVLNSNRSVTRNVSSYYIEDVRNAVLTQYFMLSFTYNLRKFNGTGQNNPRNRDRQRGDDFMRMRD